VTNLFVANSDLVQVIDTMMQQDKMHRQTIETISNIVICLAKSLPPHYVVQITKTSLLLLNCSNMQRFALSALNDLVREHPVAVQCLTKHSIKSVISHMRRESGHDGLILLEAIAYQDHSKTPIQWMIELEVLDLLYSFIINKNDVAECLLLLTSIVNESECAKDVYKHPLCEVCVGLVSSDDLRVKREAAILLTSLMLQLGDIDP
jgi:hypothetical protein